MEKTLTISLQEYDKMRQEIKQLKEDLEKATMGEYLFTHKVIYSGTGRGHVKETREWKSRDEFVKELVEHNTELKTRLDSLSDMLDAKEDELRKLEDVLKNKKRSWFRRG